MDHKMISQVCIIHVANEANPLKRCSLHRFLLLLLLNFLFYLLKDPKLRVVSTALARELSGLFGEFVDGELVRHYHGRPVVHPIFRDHVGADGGDDGLQSREGGSLRGVVRSPDQTDVLVYAVPAGLVQHHDVRGLVRVSGQVEPHVVDSAPVAVLVRSSERNVYNVELARPLQVAPEVSAAAVGRLDRSRYLHSGVGKEC